MLRVKYIDTLYTVLKNFIKIWNSSKDFKIYVKASIIQNSETLDQTISSSFQRISHDFTIAEKLKQSEIQHLLWNKSYLNFTIK